MDRKREGDMRSPPDLPNMPRGMFADRPTTATG
jgi:hypothetical protein